MVSLTLLFLILSIGSSMAFRTSDGRFVKEYFHRNSRSHDERILRSILGKLIDTETNTIYNLDGQKQQSISSNIGAAISVGPSTRFLEEIACLEACYKCVEDYPFATRKKKAADNCGPMCDCADSCSRMPSEQVNKIYGQGDSTRGDKTCFWKTYTQSLNNELPPLQ